MLAAFCNLNTVCVCVTEFQIIDFICGNTFLKAVNDEGYKRKAAAKAVAVSCVGGRQVLIINYSPSTKKCEKEFRVTFFLKLEKNLQFHSR